MHTASLKRKICFHNIFYNYITDNNPPFEIIVHLVNDIRIPQTYSSWLGKYILYRVHRKGSYQI